jgi:hypothetical protein
MPHKKVTKNSRNKGFSHFFIVDGRIRIRTNNYGSGTLSLALKYVFRKLPNIVIMAEIFSLRPWEAY